MLLGVTKFVVSFSGFCVVFVSFSVLQNINPAVLIRDLKEDPREIS